MPAAREFKVRIRNVGAFGEEMPEEARRIFEIAERERWPAMSFAVPALPPTLNHQYKTVAINRRVLTAEATTYRQIVALAIGNKRHTWKPLGAVTAVVFFLQPYWLTKKLTMRDVDGDNKLKPLQDAIQLATGVPDFTNWHVHLFKIVTQREVKTVVYMFDRGEEIEVYA